METSKICVGNVLRLLQNHYSGDKLACRVGQRDRELMEQIKSVIDSCMFSSMHEYVTDELLDFDEDFDTEEAEVQACIAAYTNADDSANDSAASSWNTSSNASKNESTFDVSYVPSPTHHYTGNISLEQKQSAVAYWENGVNGRRTLDSVRHSYRFVTSIKQLRRFKHQVETAGSKSDKCKAIASHTLEQFCRAKQNGLPIHDADLRRWALAKQREMHLDGFTASKKWLWQFKLENHIVSRKITHFVTRVGEVANADIKATAEQFVRDVKARTRGLRPSQIFNTDQSGFNLEIHSGRTLETAGVRTVHCVVQSVSATTHSYTIQPLISADGRLHSPLLVALHEPSGRFGPRVQAGLFNAPNLLICASASGKLTKGDLQLWFEEAYFVNAPSRSALLVDSWSTYRDSSTIADVKPAGKEVTMFTIPPKTTGQIQPLDVYFFRPWKNFVRKFSDRVLLDGLNVTLAHRNNILKLQSLVHCQFSSPRFKEMVRYAWCKSGYFEREAVKFENPVDFCFALSDGACAGDGVCARPVFVTFAWCKRELCFKHFFEDYHYCEDYRL